MNKFVRNFLTEWRKLSLPFEDETFIVAVSGGADSVSLLLVLSELRQQKKLKDRFVIAHFNHNLRGDESEKDAEFVKVLADKLEFEFVAGVASQTAPIADQKGNLEQNARNSRYEFLQQTAEGLNAYGVLTAHTLNDQAETFLLNLIRGSGIEGLSGMKPIRFLDTETRRRGDTERTVELEPNISASPRHSVTASLSLVRPLLTWAKREDTEKFCRLKKIEYRSDSMNDDEAFTRIRIRKNLIPMLTAFNPRIIETLAKTASLLREDFTELQGIAQQKASQIENQSGSNELKLKEIRNLLPSSRLRVLREWLKNNRGDLRSLDAKHFDAIEKIIFSRKSGKTIELPKLESIVKKDGKLIFKKGSSLVEPS